MWIEDQQAYSDTIRCSLKLQQKGIVFPGIPENYLFLTYCLLSLNANGGMILQKVLKRSNHTRREHKLSPIYIIVNFDQGLCLLLP